MAKWGNLTIATAERDASLTYGSNPDGGLSFFDGKGQCVGQVANDDLLRLIQQAAKLLTK